MTRKILRHFLLNLFGKFRDIDIGVHILNSHYIGLTNNSSDIFYNLLKNLNTEVDFINFEEACKIICRKEKTNQKLVAFSYDDGFEECYTNIVPVLNQFNVNAAFFINPNFINGDEEYRKKFVSDRLELPIYKAPMSWGMLKDLHSKGFIIGSHTMDHQRLVNLKTKKELNYQIIESKRIIENYLSNKCEYFAWPYGRLTDIQNEGLKIAVNNYRYVFSASNYKKYFSFNNQVINRRHFEGDWPISHLRFFLADKQYDTN